jgi:KDO2-lipid IV(A) lauroyltransferase
MRRANVSDARSVAASMYRSLGAGIFELLWLAGKGPEQRDAAIAEHVVLEDDFAVALHEACERGPVVLAASPTGNWELAAFGAARALGASGRRLAVVVKPQSVGVFHAFCTHLREACGLRLIAPEGAFGAARRSLAAGDVIAMPIDQVPGRKRHGVRVPFLGAQAFADRAPAAVARATGATLLVVATSRQGRRQHIHLLAELPPHGRGESTASAWITNATRESTRALDAFVIAEPASWLWLHRRWRAPLEVRGTSTQGRARLVVPAVPG